MSLMEALVSIVLMSILGLGMTYSLAKATLAQRNMNAQNQIMSKLRYKIQDEGIYSDCPSSGSSTQTITIADLPADASVQKICTMTNVQVSAAGLTQTIATPVIEYSVSSTSYLGSGNQLKLKN